MIEVIVYALPKTLDPGWVALIGTLFGAAILKVVEKQLSKSKEKIDAKAQEGRDYRAEIKELSERLDASEDKETVWREKYYKSQEENLELKVAKKADDVL